MHAWRAVVCACGSLSDTQPAHSGRRGSPVRRWGGSQSICVFWGRVPFSLFLLGGLFLSVGFACEDPLVVPSINELRRVIGGREWYEEAVGSKVDSMVFSLSYFDAKK